jgi:GntR family transcriptional repressor for pyruvate dehydrogenase complex
MSDVIHHTCTISGDNTIFTPLAAREPLSKKIAGEIQDAIRTRKLAPGEKLPTEQQLGEQFGVSRTAVREAVRMLSARGLISIVKGKGIFVRPFSAETVTDPLHMYLQLASERNYALDLIRARQLIEPSLAEEAALRRTDEDLKRLHQDMDRLQACPEDSPELASLDMAFHLDVARATQNLLMPLLLDPIHRMMPEIKSSVYATVRNAKGSALIWHEKVLEMIAAEDPKGARSAMEEHLRIAEDHVKKMLAAQHSESSHHRSGKKP